MNEVKLPALSGDSPLGILAALGVLRLLTEFTSERPQLRWDPADYAAVLRGPWSDVEGVAAELVTIVTAMPHMSLIPGVGPGFPPPGAAPDGLRVPQTRLREADRQLLRSMTAEEQGEARGWLASLVTDLAADNDGRVAISKYTAPSGKQSMATMLEKPLQLVRKEPDLLRQALSSWRRVPDVTGEYLDHRALWDATEDGGGTPRMRGVPGATWLALMSYPLMRSTISLRRRPTTSGWHTAGGAGGRSYDELRLPVWRQPLGTYAITALIEHPALATKDWSGALPSDAQAALGIFHVCRARRYQPPGSQAAGVLAPVEP